MDVGFENSRNVRENCFRWPKLLRTWVPVAFLETGDTKSLLATWLKCLCSASHYLYNQTLQHRDKYQPCAAALPDVEH